MSIEKVKKQLESFGLSDRIREFTVSSATVELAAAALNVPPEVIAKTIAVSDKSGEGCILIVTAGDNKLCSKKFKQQFGFKPKMLKFDEVEQKTGHPVGGVCPFGVDEGASVYLDASLKRFEKIYPAAGTVNTAVEITLDELKKVTGRDEFIDVCKEAEEK